MANINLKPLSLKELNALKTRIDSAIARHEKKSKTAALAKLKKTASSMGFSLEDLVGGPAKPSKRTQKKNSAPLPAQYRDPANAENTWSGRGARPKWLREQLAKGKALEEFKIKG